MDVWTRRRGSRKRDRREGNAAAEREAKDLSHYLLRKIPAKVRNFLIFFGPVLSSHCLKLGPSAILALMLRNLIFSWSGTLAESGRVGGALRPQALGFLNFARETGRRLFVLGTPEEGSLREEAARLGVAHFFERIHGRGRPIKELMAECALCANETALIDHRGSEIDAARRAGLLTIATEHDSGGEDGRRSADVRVRDLGQLRRLLETVPSHDKILIEELELSAHIGVPAEERARPQRLVVSLALVPRHRFDELQDDLAHTVDYAAVSAVLRELVAARRDRLLETLAEEMAAHLLRIFPLDRVELELRKFILPETKYVAVQLGRTAAAAR